MKKIYIYCLVVLLNVFYGCENEFDYKFNQGQNNYVLKAKIEQSDLSRTLLNGNRVEWAEGDVIGVYGDKGSINVSFEHKQLDDFVGCLEEDEYPLWSYYPYDSMAVFDKSTLTFTLPSTFDYTSNSNAPMIGVKQNDDSFVFRHLCGLLKFSVDSIPVDSTFLVISSEGNPAPAIAGKVMVDDVLAQNAILVANDNIKDITINMNRNVGSRTFYIPLPVGKYPLLKVALFAKDSTLLFSNSISDVEIKRAVMLNICKNEGSEVIISPIENIKNVIQRNKNKKKDELLNILVRVFENYIDDDVICVYPPIDSSFKDGLIEIEEKGKNNPQKIGVYIEPENASVDGQFEIPNTPRNHWVSKVKSFESGKLNNSGKDSYDDILDNTNILCWVPFYKEIPHISVDDELVKDSPLDLKRNVYDNERATYANLVGNLSANGIVSITTHGSEGKYIFVPDKDALGKKGFEIYWLYCEGDRYVDAKIMYPLMAEHFYGYNFYENAIVYNTSCFSYSNKTSTNDKLLNNQFSTMGISTYAGYSNVVYPGNDKALASEYYYNLFHELKSNKQSVPKDCFYSMGSSIIGTLKFDLWREVRFVDFRPKGSVLIDEENVTLPFEFKGVGNLKEDCYIGLLIGDNERLDSLKYENYHMVKYSIDHFNEDNSLFNVKIPLQQYKGFLVEKGLSVEDKMFYRVFLEYNNRRWISDECCEFSIDCKPTYSPITLDATEIKSVSVVLNAKMDGWNKLLANFGFCYSKNNENLDVNNGVKHGEIIRSINDDDYTKYNSAILEFLEPGTTYYYRAYIYLYSNSQYYYGDVKSFTTTVESPVNVAEDVDLGLSVKWASHNVGATKPEEYGDYYAWGETEEKEKYTVWNYKFYNMMTGEMTDLGEEISGTKYDVAKIKWGDGWRMPTTDEMLELTEECEWTDTICGGVKGKKVTGVNGNSIFLPAAGMGAPGSDTFKPGEFGLYWLGTLNETYLGGEYLYFEFGYPEWISYGASREHGQPVRPVKDK